MNRRGQLGHLQSELEEPVWPLPVKHDATTFRFLKSLAWPMEQTFNCQKEKPDSILWTGR